MYFVSNNVMNCSSMVDICFQDFPFTWSKCLGMSTDLTRPLLLFLHAGFDWQPAASPLWPDSTRGQAVLDRLAVQEHPERWQAHRLGKTHTGRKPGEPHGHSHVPPTPRDRSVCVHTLDQDWSAHVHVEQWRIFFHCFVSCCNTLDLKWIKRSWLRGLTADFQL